jgi:hypothetical protein
MDIVFNQVNTTGGYNQQGQQNGESRDAQRTTTSRNAPMPSFCHYETALTDRNTMPAPSEQGNC